MLTNQVQAWLAGSQHTAWGAGGRVNDHHSHHSKLKFTTTDHSSTFTKSDAPTILNCFLHLTAAICLWRILPN